MTFEKIEARMFPHAIGDQRKPTAYRVLDEKGHWLGEVHSRSTASWSMYGRVRNRFLGYARWWEARRPNETLNRNFNTRAAAARALLERDH